LILSPRAYNARAGLAVACPVTSHAKGYPFEVGLPNSGIVKGVVLADHVKNLDWAARRIEFAAKAPPEVLTDVRERLRALIGL
jgi:mRNA interferase MazF